MRKKLGTSSGSRFILGRDHFAKISEVEGIHLDRGMREEFQEFDRRGAPAAERRRTLAAKYGRKS